ncbi:hypothetical protein F5Y14DRAFT_7233 [Nemania sp. NC0429]|nr:hypothetical protein F5Y14DRAFT_7233 [Nemania sp. NC0429]
MSLLYRWSLPTRGFIRDKFQDGESFGRSKCPTVQIGRSDSHRRPDLSSAFSALFASPENRRNIRNADERSENVDDLPLLAPRRENLLPEITVKYSHSHAHGCHDSNPAVATSPSKVNRLESERNDAQIARTEPPPCLRPGGISQDMVDQVHETPKMRSFSLSSTETAEEEENRAEPLALQSPAPSDYYCERVRSTSSSYPSEGIRSPPAGYRSPDATISRTKDYFAEYRKFGQYPSQSLRDLLSTPTGEEPPRGDVRAHIQAVAVDRDSVSNRALASPDSTPKASSRLTRSPRDLVETQCSTGMQGVTQQQEGSSSNSETTVPILANEDSNSSQLEISFASYKRLSAHGTSDDRAAYQVDGGEAASTDPLRPSGDTDRSVPTAVRRTSLSDGQDAWSTIRNTEDELLSRRSSWARLFTSTAPRRSSSNSLSRRIQKLRVRKWIKRVYFKTKARFELVGRPVPKPKPKRGSSRARRRSWLRKERKGYVTRILKRRPRKEKKKGEGWGVGKDVEATEERTRQHKTLVDRLFGAPARKSLPSGPLRSEQDNKASTTHS